MSANQNFIDVDNPRNRAGLLWRHVPDMLGLDLRSLAAFRIGIAGLILVDLIARLQDLQAHYCDDGVLPRTALIQLYHTNAYWSLNMLSGGWQLQALLFAISGVFALMLLVGYRTRLATVACWVLLLSLHSRNPLILSGGDTMLRVMLFWSMFVPLGRCWSVDQMIRREPLHSYQFLSCATLILLLQIFLMYWFASLFKRNAEWIQDGTALYYAMNIDHFVRPLGRYLLNYPWLLQKLSYAMFHLEVYGPFLFFFPFYTNWTRLLGVVLFGSFHLGILLTMNLGIFPWVCWTALLLFVPGQVWEFLSARLQFARVVSFDGPRRWLESQLPAVVMNTDRSDQLIRQSQFQNSATGLAFRLLMNCGLIVLFALVVGWNLKSLDAEKWSHWLPESGREFVRYVRLDQKWNMFAEPMKDDGWFMIPATFSDGSQLDLLTMGTITDAKPVVASTYPNWRWRKYMTNLWLKKHRPARRYFAAYLSRQWLESSDTFTPDMTGLTLYYWVERTNPAPPHSLRKVELYRYPPAESTATSAAEQAQSMETKTLVWEPDGDENEEKIE